MVRSRKLQRNQMSDFSGDADRAFLFASNMRFHVMMPAVRHVLLKATPRTHRDQKKVRTILGFPKLQLLQRL